ncbi:MAG: glycoside hydrolase family 66 protein, partial [Prevotella sp.]|nr:glycoside hydrolase family 66 protein [Prevotella sp.]
LKASEKVNKVWVASPDIHGGAMQELTFVQKDGFVTFTVPSLKYWTMIVLE